MKKNTLIRSEKPHAVKVEEGSSVAQRKSAKKSAPLPSEDVPDNLQKMAAIPSKKSEPLRIEPTLTPAAGKAKPPSKRSAPSAAKPLKKSPEKAPAQSKAQRTPDAPPVWEKDNPIKHRIEALKIRNAELAEQLQRLQPTPPIRGKQS